MDVYYEQTFHINTLDTDPFGQCRPSALLGYLQEAATGAAEDKHFTREELLRDYNVFWMLARIWYRLEKPIYWDRNLMVRTWHRGNQGVTMYRDYDLYVDGAFVGEAVSAWVLVDVNTRKLFRLSNVPTFQNSAGGTLCKEKTLQKLRIPSDLPLTEKRLLHYSDTDINGHVNNSRYADFVCDAVGLAEMGKGKFVSSLQLGYLAECRAGETLCIHAGQKDGNWYIHGLDQDAVPRFDATMIISPIDNTCNIT
jgi:acyl-ACP thioesterase